MFIIRNTLQQLSYNPLTRSSVAGIICSGQINATQIRTNVIHHLSQPTEAERVHKQATRPTEDDKQITMNWIPDSDKILKKPDAAYVSSIIKQDFFGLNDLYTLEDLMKARVHFGHKDSMLNEYMRPYIFGKRLGVTIIDLDQTDKMLKYALNVTAEIAYRQGIVLFVHQSRQTGYLVEAAAKECNEYAYCRRWIGSVLTNSQTTFGAVTRLPDLIIIFGCTENVNDTHRAIKMAAKMLIPTVGICDTNADPSLVTYPVPGNDDSPQSIELYCNLFKKAIMAGKTKRPDDVTTSDDS